MNNKEKILEILIEITRVSNDFSMNFHEKVKEIIHMIVGAVGSEKGSIMLVKSKNLEVVASTRTELIGVRQPLSEQTPSVWVVKNKKALSINPEKISDELPIKIGRYQKNSYFLAPVFSGNKVIGVINLTEKKGQDCFSKTEQELVLSISGNVISALENFRLAETLKKNQKTLTLKNRQLKKLEALRSDLFKMLIHDLKGPISEVTANLDILTYTSSSENKEYVAAAQSGCDTLYRMILNLLDISRLEEKIMPLIMEKLEPEDFLRESISRVISLARNKDIKINENFPTGSDKICYFMGDRDLLTRVMQNLLMNAINYSPPDKTIEVGFDQSQKGKIVLFVKDRGPGIEPSFHDLIFDKYFQITQKSRGSNYSTGLGLTFCRLALISHSGKIWVESDGKNGSTFSFQLKTIGD